MDLIRYPDDQCPPGWKAPVLALGNFDGLHRGHMKIIDRVHRTAEERGATPVVLTFDPHPTRVLRPDKAPRVLMTEAQKVEVLGAAGMRGNWRGLAAMQGRGWKSRLPAPAAPPIKRREP